jgi:hypothetical protein
MNLENNSGQAKGVEYLKKDKIGLKEGQKGDTRLLIQKWLRASEKGISHAQDPERGARNLERIKEFFHSKYVQTLETFPREAYLRVQNEANLAQGRGRITDQLSTEQIDQRINIEIANIKDSLNPWIEYFTSPDSSSIPIWAKYWAFLGVVKMSGKMKIDEATGKISFPKRETNTISEFPELNREALALAVDHILAFVEKGQKLDETLNKLNFSDVYAHYLNNLRGELGQSELQITEGDWVKYNKGNNPETINALVDSLKGKFTHWCTAGRATAKSQLASGDFYVYYTKSASERPNPRIAIRMEGKTIVEIRGIDANQNMDKVIAGTDILDQKLTEFGEEGRSYKIKSENMRRLSGIYNTLRKDPTYQLSDEDRRFLDSRPEGFGYDEDPRIEEILSLDTLKKKYNITEIDPTSIDLLINQGEENNLVNYLAFVNPKFHQYFADKLIDAGEGRGVVWNLEKFSGLDHVEIANKLIDAGVGEAVVYSLDRFSGLNHVEIANKLIDAGQSKAVAENLGKFSGLNSEIAIKLIDAGELQSLWILKNFRGLNAEVANKLFDAGGGWIVPTNLENFSGLNAEIANKLIDAGNGEYVAKYLEKFSGLDHVEIANKLIDAGKGNAVAEHLEKFSGLNSEIANKLIDAGNGEYVAYYLENFSGLNHIEIANKLIDEEQGEVVAYYLDKFSGLNHVEIPYKLIDRGKGWSVAYNLEKFSSLDHVEFANKLIEVGQGFSVANNLENFSGLDHVEIANKLINAGEGNVVAENLEKFSGLNHVEIANKLINAGKGNAVAEHLEKFSGLNHIEIANKLIYAQQGRSIANNLKKFSGLNSEIANELIDVGQIDGVAENLEKFSGLNSEIAIKLIDRGKGLYVIYHLEKFSGLNSEIARKLLSSGLISIENLKQYKDSFIGIDELIQ